MSLAHRDHPYHSDPNLYHTRTHDVERYDNFPQWVYKNREFFRSIIDSGIHDSNAVPPILDDERHVPHNSVSNPQWVAIPTPRYQTRQIITSEQLWERIEPLAGDNTLRALVPEQRHASTVLEAAVSPPNLRAIWLTDVVGRDVPYRTMNADFVFEQLACHPTPRLERVYVQNRNFSMAQVNVRDPCAPPLRLQALYMEGCRITHRSLFLQCNLRTLELSRCNNVWDTFEQLAYTLRLMPRLTTLTLGHGALPPSAKASWPITITPVDLPLLENVGLFGDVVQVYSSLACLQSGSRPKVRLNVLALPQVEANDTHYYRMATVVLNYLKRTHIPQEIHTVHLETDAAGGFVIRAHFWLDKDPIHYKEFGSLYITMCPSHPSTESTYGDCVEGGLKLLWGLHCCWIYCVCVVVHHPAFGSQWRSSKLYWSKLKYYMPMIDCLVVTHDIAATLVHVMRVSHTGGPQNYPDVFPSLQSLSIQRADFHKVPARASGQMALFDELKLALESRREAGAGPNHLDIQRSAITPNMVAALTNALKRPSKRAHGRVYWDSATRRQ
ncbi:hypothetical protein FA95DRAFT_1682492 [Auriscalpium vulgare]|uniref:Uncharacterized protein n=1 Tax=Auriscalpium vulgare TaxID=40419 RepID=A0ACB8RFZ8_9AGAM|nr:hypothetical protein FA95DRAFT_1682492 [Auriscalpium vulgare]